MSKGDDQNKDHYKYLIAKEAASKINLTAPWGSSQVLSNAGDFNDSKTARLFIEKRSEVHTAYILEQEKTKRLSLILAVVLLISAMVIILIAPTGKEIMSYWIGAALLVFSAGSAGYKRVWAKTDLLEFEANQKDKLNRP